MLAWLHCKVKVALLVDKVGVVKAVATGILLYVVGSTKVKVIEGMVLYIAWLVPVIVNVTVTIAPTPKDPAVCLKMKYSFPSKTVELNVVELKSVKRDT